MSAYTDRVAHNLNGCEAVSAGVCPGCDTCRGEFGEYRVTSDYDEQEREFYSFKARADERYDTEELAEQASRSAFDEDWCNGDAPSESHFSWWPCDICGSRLGGDREVWHYVADGKLRHGAGACVDCIVYLANGDEPVEVAS